MATTLTLTPKPDVGAVLIEITGAPAGAVTILRVDDNGTANVRLQENQQPLGGSLTIFDYEALLNGLVTYSVTDSASVVTTGQVTTAVANPFLTAPILPHYQQSLTAVTDYDANQETSTTVHWVIDRADPLVITGPLRFRKGSLEMYAEDYATAEAIREVASHGEVLLLRQADYLGMDMYFIPERAVVRPRTMDTLPRRWTVAIDYIEVKIPGGPVQSGTWNFDGVKALGTFNAALALFPTFNKLVAGP